MTYRILGARGKIEDPAEILRAVEAWADRRGVEVLMADARSVVGRDHLESAVRHAIRSRAAGTAVGRSLRIDALRYLAAKRQVSDALHTAGVRRGTETVALVVFGEADPEELVRSLGWERDDEILRVEGKSLEGFGISKKEAQTVPDDRIADLVLERAALLDVQG
jgi:KEOPS complex subunit Cgi121